jgi:hypothetical protein
MLGKPLAALHAEGFRVRMPGSPQRSEDPVPIPIVGPAKDLVGPTTAITYTSESDDKAFAITVIEGPTAVGFDRDAAIAGLAGTFGGTLRDSAKTRYRGHPSIDATIDGVEGERTTAFVRVVHAGRRVFVLQAHVDAERADTPPPAYADILASLQIAIPARRPAGADDPIVARKIATKPPVSVAAGLAHCHRQAVGQAVSDDVRRTVKQLCENADGTGLAGVQQAIFAACMAVAQQTSELERCGFEIVSPK